MISQQTQDQMNALEARLVSYGVEVSSMRSYSFNAVIGAILSTADGGNIELEYHRNSPFEFAIDGKFFVGLRCALESVGLLAPVVESEDDECISEELEVAAPIIETQETTAMTTTITKQDVYECVTNPCDYFFNGEPITEWTVIDNGISIITEDDFGSTQYNLAWPCVVESTPLKLSSTMLGAMLVAPVTSSVTEPALQVGDTVSMEHLCEVTPVGGSKEGMCLEVRYGREYYLVNLPAVFCIHGDDGSFTWTEGAVGQVLSEEYCFCNY